MCKLHVATLVPKKCVSTQPPLCTFPPFTLLPTLCLTQRHLQLLGTCTADARQPPSCAHAAEERSAAEAVAGAGQQPDHSVIEISDDDADVGSDGGSPAGAGGKQQSDSAAEDDGEDILIDMADDRLVKAEDDPGQVGYAAGSMCMYRCSTCKHVKLAESTQMKIRLQT